MMTNKIVDDQDSVLNVDPTVDADLLPMDLDQLGA